MVICLSPGGQTTTVGDRPNGQLLVGTTEGVFSFTRKNGSWGSQERFLESEHISALLVEPSSQTLFAATYGGTLYTSKDLGSNWERRDQGLGKLRIFSMAVQQIGGRPRLYVGTQPAHLFFSDDLGKSWTELPGLRQVSSVEQWTFGGMPGLGHLKCIGVDSRLPNVIYAAIEVGGLLKSEDGGSTWKEFSGLNPDVHRIVFASSDPQKVFLVMPTTNRDYEPSQTAGVCVSHDGGRHWASLTPKDFRLGYVDQLVIVPQNDDFIFTAGARTGPGAWRRTHTADPRIARSRNGGRSWEILNKGLPEEIRGNIEAMSMDVWNGGFALFAGTTDGEVFYSEDEGEHWQTIVEGIGAVSKDHHYRNLQVSAA